MLLVGVATSFAVSHAVPQAYTATGQFGLLNQAVRPVAPTPTPRQHTPVPAVHSRGPGSHTSTPPASPTPTHTAVARPTPTPTPTTTVVDPYRDNPSQLQAAVRAALAEPAFHNLAAAHSGHVSFAVDPAHKQPVFDVTATGYPRSETVDVVNQVLALAATEVTNIQLSVGAPRATLVREFVVLRPSSTTNAKTSRGKRLLAGTVGSVLLAILVAVVLDVVLRRRRTDAASA